MSRKGAYAALMTSAMIVAGIRLWMQVRGKTKTPFPEWAIGWGATFFLLALLLEAAPALAGGIALLVAFTDFLNNGVSLTKDVSTIITDSEKGNSAPVFVPTPFAQGSQSGNVKPPGRTQG